MNTRPMFRRFVVAAALAVAGTTAFADGDIYSRLMQLHAQKIAKDSMVSKDDFLAMVSKAWDMQADEMKIRSGKMTPEQLKQLEKLLGRTLTAQSEL